jgi:hypothetical protein
MVSFTITDNLGDVQVSEQLVVYLNGRKMGTIGINRNSQSDYLPLEVPPGNYDYQLDAEYTYVDDSGNLQRDRASGHGTIFVSEGVKFAVDTVGSGSNFEYSLQQVS